MILNRLGLILKSLIFGILAIFSKALCCLSRRRKYSQTEDDCEVLSSISVVQNDNSFTNKSKNEREIDWNSWDDRPKTIDEHIEKYRESLGRPVIPPKEQETDIDFFKNMAPTINRQTKHLIATNQSNNNNNQSNNFSRLQANTGIIPVSGPELQDLSDNDDNNMDGTTDSTLGWDELNDESTKRLLREKRKEMRAQRQLQQVQRSNQFKSHQNKIIAERIGGSRHS